MLSEGKQNEQNGNMSGTQNTANNTPAAFTARLKFVKKGNLQYISHLDLQRTFNRVMKRSQIPLWYTKGFNPHPKLVFSSPLSIGTESECEYLDVKIDSDISCREIMERMNRELTDELYITDVYIPSTKFSDIAWALYEINVFTDNASSTLAADTEYLFSHSPLTAVKNTKAGEREIDIIPLIKSFEARFDAERGIVGMVTTLAASPDKYLNPEMLVGAMKQKLGVLSGDPTRQWYTVMRKDLLCSDGTSFR